MAAPARLAGGWPLRRAAGPWDAALAAPRSGRLSSAQVRLNLPCHATTTRGSGLCSAPSMPAALPLPAAWDEELVGALTQAADARSADEAREQITAMLGKLGDPFTRWLPQK